MDSAFDYHGRQAGAQPGHSFVWHTPGLAGLAVSLCLMVVAAGLYHWVFLKGAREGWPIVGSLVRLVVKDEFAERDRFMRANLDAMARRVGEMQARMVQLESLGDRVLGLAGMAPADIPKQDARAVPW